MSRYNYYSTVKNGRRKFIRTNGQKTTVIADTGNGIKMFTSEKNYPVEDFIIEEFKECHKRDFYHAKAEYEKYNNITA